MWRIKKMINTYNESRLHEKLKELYALESNGSMEVKLDDTPWICDIIDENGNAIEIQTSNLSALTEKAEYILETGRKLKIVHPVAQLKWIELYSADGSFLHRKKSPKKSTIYDSLRGMTKICPLFLHENCQLELLYCEISEMRRKTEKPSQTQNNARRHLKDWLPMGKKLDKITGRERLCTREDWEKLLPEKLRQNTEEGACRQFRACDLARELKAEKGSQAAKWSSLVIWILTKMQILEVTEVKGKSRYYSIRKKT